MGNQYSMPSPAPGTTQIDTEPAECCSSVPCKQRLWDDQAPKPLGAAAWPDSRWRDFSSEMGTLVRTYKKDGYAAFAFLLFPIGIFIMLASFAIPDPPVIMRVIHVPFIILGILIFIVISSHVKPANQAVDRKIEELCRRYSDGHVTLQYVTMFTGVCKPKGAQTYRSLWVSPGGGSTPVMAVGQPMVPAGMQTMSVTCPAGCKAGDSVAITTPSGQQMQVQIPTGVVEGQAFHVQVPAAPPVAVATVVTAVPA